MERDPVLPEELRSAHLSESYREAPDHLHGRGCLDSRRCTPPTSYRASMGIIGPLLLPLAILPSHRHTPIKSIPIHSTSYRRLDYIPKRGQLKNKPRRLNKLPKQCTSFSVLAPMGLYGLLWPHMGLYGPPWSYLDLPGPALPFLGLYGPLWASLGLLRPFWPSLAHLPSYRHTPIKTY